LDEVIKVTNRRVNALEYLVIPRFIATVGYINQELDEQSREDYYRLKKVLDNKKKMIAEAAAIAEKDAREKGLQNKPQDASSGFGDEKDEDILFWKEIQYARVVIGLSAVWEQRNK